MKAQQIGTNRSDSFADAKKPQTKAFHFCDYCANKAVELVEQARADERAKILKEVLKRHNGEYDKYDPTPNQFIPWLRAELKKEQKT